MRTHGILRLSDEKVVIEGDRKGCLRILALLGLSSYDLVERTSSGWRFSSFVLPVIEEESN